MGRSVEQDMPELYAWIEDLRSVFGRDAINQCIVDGLDGKSTFWLCENGHELGAPGPRGVQASASFVHPKDRKRD